MYMVTKQAIKQIHLNEFPIKLFSPLWWILQDDETAVLLLRVEFVVVDVDVTGVVPLVVLVTGVGAGGGGVEGNTGIFLAGVALQLIE